MANDEIYSYENGVLKNRYNIKNEAWLSEAEVHFTARRGAELSANPIKGNFDLEHLKQIHHHLFQDVYEWAGEARLVEISKGNSHFCRTDLIVPYASKVFKDLAADLPSLKECNTIRFCEKVGHHLGEINALHPFREGNGRTQREFIKQLAEECGRSIEWKNVSQEKMIEASIQAMQGKTDKMVDVLLDCVGKQREKGLGRD